MIYILLNFLLVGFVFAQNPDCPDELPDIASKTKFQNCASTQAKDLLSTKPADTSSLCGCAAKLKENKKILKLPVDESPFNIKAKLEGELLKALTDNLVNVSKLKPLPGIHNFPNATKACDIDGFIKSSGCKGFSIDLKKKLAEELGNLLSPKAQRNDLGAMDRSKRAPNSCEIPDSLIMQANANLLVNQITPELIGEISKTPLKSVDEIKGFLDKKSLYRVFQNHPTFSILLRKPEKFASFFSTLKPTPEGIKSALYESEDIDKVMDQEIANNCTSALDTYKTAACTNTSDKIKFSSLSETPSLFDANTFVYDEDDDIDFEDSKMVNANNEIIKFCSSLSNDKSAINISQPFAKINAQVSEAFREKSYSDYKSGKYSFDFESQRTSICAQPEGCTEDIQACKLANLIRKAQKADTEENRLASSSDEGLRKLLRSFVGETPTAEISANTQQVLISQGIWPKGDGTFTAQKRVPERETKFYSEQASAERAALPSTPAQSTQAAIAQPQANRVSRSTDFGNEPIVPTQKPAPSTSPTTGLNPQASNFDADMNELKRKVSQLKSESSSTGQKNPQRVPTSNESNANTQERISATTSQNSFSNHRDDSDSYTQRGSGEGFGTTPDTRDTRDPEKLKNQRDYAERQKALSGMRGDKGSAGGASGKSGAGVAGAGGVDSGNGADGNTLAVNVPEEKLKAEISQILNKNELKNLEALAHSRKDFVFKINEAVFQVKFNPATRLYAVEVSSGRSEMSERLKSDLVDYLNKLNKRTTSLDSLNKNFK